MFWLFSCVVELARGHLSCLPSCTVLLARGHLCCIPSAAGASAIPFLFVAPGDCKAHDSSRHAEEMLGDTCCFQMPLSCVLCMCPLGSAAVHALRWFHHLRRHPGVQLARHHLTHASRTPRMPGRRAGKNLGRTKFTEISPKKTVEGALGGLLSSTCVALGLWKVTHWPATPLAAAGMGVSLGFRAGTRRLRAVPQLPLHTAYRTHGASHMLVPSTLPHTLVPSFHCTHCLEAAGACKDMSVSSAYGGPTGGICWHHACEPT